MASEIASDRGFAALLAVEGLVAVVLAATAGPHLRWAAALAGVAGSAPAIALSVLRPGAPRTRHVNACAQLLWSALFLDGLGAQLDVEILLFASLALLAVYEHAARAAELEELRGSVEQQVATRTAQLEASRERYRRLVEDARAVPWEISTRTWRSCYVGPQIVRLLGCDRDAWRARHFWAERIHADDLEAARAFFRNTSVMGAERETEFRLRHDDGRWIWVRCIAADVEPSGRATRRRGLLLDVTERRKLELELRQAQKLESVGRLAAGIAHEINTPVQFVSDSIHFVRDGLNDLTEVLGAYQATMATFARRADLAAEVAAVERAAEAADLPYLVANVPPALDAAIEGLDRITAIVRAMKEFAHPDRREMASTDLNQMVTSTLTIARNEYKYVADLVTDLGDLPPVECHAGEINQAVLNILVNAAHAIEDRKQRTGGRGVITVRTRREGDHVTVAISDTGDGIPDAIRHRVFEPFFTTKEVGRGTGQGLAIARAVIHEKHGGELAFETEAGVGTTFVLRLPVAALRHVAAAS